jgi:hypothetical protein
MSCSIHGQAFGTCPSCYWRSDEYLVQISEAERLWQLGETYALLSALPLRSIKALAQRPTTRLEGPKQVLPVVVFFDAPFLNISTTMKSTFTSLLALAAVATALPSQNQKRACSSAVSLDASTNVWDSYTLHPNSFYRAEVEAAAANISDSTLAAKALEVADIGTFLWL